MNKKVKKKWLKALRSGKYQQTHEALRNDEGYCCLGVLSHLAYKHGACERDKADDTEAGKFVYGVQRENAYLPVEVRLWADLNDIEVVYEGKPHSLIYLNDSLDLSFKQIADVIEEQL